MSDKPSVLLIGLEPSVSTALTAVLEKFKTLDRKLEPEILEAPVQDDIQLILCGPSSADLPAIELGQTLRMQYSKANIYYVAENRQSFNRKLLQKNGFTDAFLLPSDLPTLRGELDREYTKLSSHKQVSYRNVQLVDITPNTELGFDLYLHLPANNRKVRYISSKESLGEDRAKKLKEKQVQSILVSEDQMQKFYDFTAKQLKALGNDTALSETEKRDRREKAVRDLMMGVLSDSGKDDTIEHGRQVLEQCQEIVKSFILNPANEKDSWVEKFMTASNTESTPYSHSSNTATYSTLMSIAFNIGDPKELAMAGLLHDIGLADVSTEICNKSEAERNKEEEEKYRKHPMYSTNLIKERKMIVSEKVLKMIEQHHERYDGQGYPTQMPGPKILPEAQILALADELVEMTTVKEGFPRISLKAAMQEIYQKGVSNPSGSTYDPQILQKLKTTFLVEN